MQHSELVRVKRSPGKGRGVFARKAIKKGQVIEHVPVMLVPFADIAGGPRNPNLAKVFYLWNRDHAAITLGYGSIYNHSYRPNATYRHRYMSMEYVALRDIVPGEEIVINYNGDPKLRDPMEFAVVESNGAAKMNSKRGARRLTRRR